MKMIEIECTYCHKKEDLKLKYVSYKRKKGQINFFCSKKCSIKNSKRKLIVKNCLNCNKQFETLEGCESLKCCSRTCSAIYSHSFVDPNVISKKSKEAWKRGCYKNRTFKLRKYKICSICNNKFYGTKKYCSLICLKNSDINLRISNTRKQMFKNNLLKVTGGTTKWIQYKDIKVQGSYEYRTCIILDEWLELGKIKKWEYTNDRFSYLGTDGNPHNYLLDFKVWNYDNSFYYLETKGFEKENDKLKWKSVRDRGFKLEVWFEKEISNEEHINGFVNHILELIKEYTLNLEDAGDWKNISHQLPNTIRLSLINEDNIPAFERKRTPNILGDKHYAGYLHEIGHAIIKTDGNKTYENEILTQYGWEEEKNAWKKAKEISKWWTSDMTEQCRISLKSYQNGCGKKLNISNEEIEDFISALLS